LNKQKIKKKSHKKFCCKQNYKNSKQEAPSSTPTLLRLIYQKSDGRYVLTPKSAPAKSLMLNLLINPIYK